MRLSLGPPAAFSAAGFSHLLRVYWEDTDAGGVVFYANYLKFFERARTEWLRALGVEQQALRDATHAIFVVTDTTLRYRAPEWSRTGPASGGLRTSASKPFRVFSGWRAIS